MVHPSPKPWYAGLLEVWERYFPPGSAPMAATAHVTPAGPAPVIRGIDGDSSFLDAAVLLQTRGVYWHHQARPDFLLDHDPRLEKVIARVQEEQRFQQSVPSAGHAHASEQAVVNAAVAAIEANYGAYNPGVSGAFGALGAAKTDPARLAALGRLDAGEDHHTRVSEMPYGASVCRQRAAILSYALARAGIPNYYVLGVMTGDTPGQYNPGHAWVQLKASGNIADPSAPAATSYQVNLNHASVKDIVAGVPVIAAHDYGGKGAVYGTGFREEAGQAAILAARRQGNLAATCRAHLPPLGEHHRLDVYQSRVLTVATGGKQVFPDSKLQAAAPSIAHASPVVPCDSHLPPAVTPSMSKAEKKQR